MSAYAAVEDVISRFRELDADEKAKCEILLEDAAIIIDSYNADASDSAKKIVSCSMVARAIGDGDSESTIPIGATQGSMSAMGYSQSYTFGSGSAGELYLTKSEKHLLGVGNNIGSHSPLEDLVDD